MIRWSRQKRRARPRVFDGRFAAIVGAVMVGAFVVAWRIPIAEIAPRETTVAPAAGGLAVPPRATLTCRVAYINDGDTLRCADGARVRLHAVAAREADESCSPGHPCPAATAEAATRELTRLAAGQILRCQPTGQSYERITAICWTPEGVEINCAMVRSGTALIWDKFDRRAPLCRT